MRNAILSVALSFLAMTASAQMHRQQPGTMSGPMHFAVAADGSVIVLAGANQVVALHTASGNVAWTVKLTGSPMQIETAGNQIFVLVADNLDTSTMPVRSGNTRTLVAISSSGTVLWSKKLDN